MASKDSQEETEHRRGVGLDRTRAQVLSLGLPEYQHGGFNDPGKRVKVMKSFLQG